MILIVFGFARVGLWLESPGVASVPAHVSADLVVAMGGGSGERVIRASELFRQGAVSHVLFTGVENGHLRFQPHVLDASVALARAEGVPIERMHFDARARNTWEEAQATLALMRANGWQRVHVVSDPPHSRRIAYAWGRVFEGSGIQWQIVHAPSDWWEPRTWWRSERGAVWVVNEWLKLAYYRLK